MIYTPALDVLLIERADAPGFWQSVTGSRTGWTNWEETATREVMEETGIDAHALGHTLTDWALENVFHLSAVAPPLCPRCGAEHRASVWTVRANGYFGNPERARAYGVPMVALAGGRRPVFFCIECRGSSTRTCLFGQGHLTLA